MRVLGLALFGYAGFPRVRLHARSDSAPVRGESGSARHDMIGGNGGIEAAW